MDWFLYDIGLRHERVNRNSAKKRTSKSTTTAYKNDDRSVCFRFTLTLYQFNPFMHNLVKWPKMI